MNIEEAEQVEYILKSIKLYKDLGGRIHKLYKEGKHEEIANIALEMGSELLRVYTDQLSAYPSKPKI